MKHSLTVNFKPLALLWVSALLLVGCFKDATKIGNVYFNDFESFSLKNIEVFSWNNGVFSKRTDVAVTDFVGNKVLGRFNNTRLDINIPNLPQHQTISVQFDLNLHDLWKNDVWRISIDGKDLLVSGFSNDPNKWQAYPNWINNGTSLNPPGANAFTKNLPGACRLINNPNGTFQYKMEYTIYHKANTISISMSDAGEYFNLNCERSWSIDNLKVFSIN